MYGEFSTLYKKWADRYDVDHTEIEKLTSVVNFHGASLLDIGCGVGRFSYRILPYVSYLHGVDIDECAISVAETQRKHIPESKLRFSVGNGENFNLNRKFDIVIFTWSLYQMSSIPKAIKNAVKHLSPNGTLIILQPFGGQFENTFSTLHGDPDLSIYRSAVEAQIKEVTKYFSRINTIDFTGYFSFTSIDDAIEHSSFFFETDYGVPMNEKEKAIVTERLSSIGFVDNLLVSDDVKFIICSNRRKR